jgi:hypothetical protein
MDMENENRWDEFGLIVVVQNELDLEYVCLSLDIGQEDSSVTVKLCDDTGRVSEDISSLLSMKSLWQHLTSKLNTKYPEFLAELSNAGGVIYKLNGEVLIDSESEQELLLMNDDRISIESAKVVVDLVCSDHKFKLKVEVPRSIQDGQLWQTLSTKVWSLH